jgi:hypothetical protein
MHALDQTFAPPLVAAVAAVLMVYAGVGKRRLEWQRSRRPRRRDRA